MPATSLISFLWLSMGMGALSLVTPCVFPMVPITVSYFANHSAGTRSGAVRQALFYSLGIVLTFVALGLSLTLLFGAAGINKLAANPWVNLLIAAIFLGFALSLLGVFLIQLPASWVQRLNQASFNRSGHGFVGPLLMGVTFSLTSFTCTAPFVGTLLVLAARGNWRWPLVGMTGYSFVFSIPFFALALLPQMLSHLPRSGGWLNSVKVVMGFLEIAAAMKFLSNADLIWRWHILDRPAVLCIWSACLLMSAAYLLGWFHTAHDAFVPGEARSGLRVVAAFVFLAGGLWLLSAVPGRSVGSLEAFLPPAENAPARDSASATAQPDNSWLVNSLPAALAEAKAERRPVFVDFTGYTCTNCRWMEANIFPRPEVAARLSGFVKARLYTDGDGKVYEDQQAYENNHFGTVALPLYALLDSNGRTIATSAGITRNPAAFAAFLAKAE